MEFALVSQAKKRRCFHATMAWIEFLPGTSVVRILCGPLAQLAEQKLLTLLVAGSSPARPTKFMPVLRDSAPLCGCGGIGRRAGFRSLWERSRGGSSPLARTRVFSLIGFKRGPLQPFATRRKPKAGPQRQSHRPSHGGTVQLKRLQGCGPDRGRRQNCLG
jgi:hypothetical protein